jgi:hypothetical protein
MADLTFIHPSELQDGIAARPRPRSFISVLALLTLWFGSLGTQNLLAQGKSNSLPRFPDGITAAPDWLGELRVPFGVRTFFSAPAVEKNGATHYLIAMREVSTYVDSCFEADQIFNSSEVERRQRLIESHFDDFDLLARFYEIEAKRELLKKLSGCFDRLQTAQAKSRCVFQTSFDVDQPHLEGALALAKAYLLKTCVDAKDLEWDSAIDNVRRTLQIARDILPRGNTAAALTASKIEDIACRKMLPIILMEKRNTKPSYCDRLITILQEHRNDRNVPGQYAIASEWLRIQSLLNESKARPERIEAARGDLTKWFNQCFIALQEPARTRDQSLKEIHKRLILPHSQLFRSNSIADLAWTETVVDTQTDLVITLCAVRKRYMTSRKIPRSLENLFAELPVKSPPLDRLRADDLKRDQLQANFGGDVGILYSVGIDGIDGEAEQGSDDMTIQIETTGMITFLYDPFREASKPRD